MALCTGGTQTLPRTIGRSRALEMLLTNHWIGAEDTYEFGLVNRLVPRDELLQIVEDMAQKIASYDPAAVRCAKEAVVRGMDMNLEDGLNLEKLLAARLTAKRT